MNLNGCAAGQCTSHVSSRNPCGIHAVIRQPKPERHGDGRALRTQWPRSWTCSPRSPSRGFERPRAHTSTTKFSDIHLADRALGHQICHIQLTIDLRKLVLGFIFQVRRCEQVQTSESIPNLHPRISEGLRVCAARDLHNLLWIDDARRVDGR